MAYKHLSYEERLIIETLLATGYSRRKVAKFLGVNPSTVSRELQRNSTHEDYDPRDAQAKAKARWGRAPKHVRLTERLKWTIIDRLKAGWSPEQISGRLRRMGDEWVSHETIYQFIYADRANGGSLWRYLRRQRKKRGKRLKHKDRRGRIKDAVSIDERPAVVEHRSRVGDWELDTVIGKGHQGALVTMVERKTKMTFIAHVRTRKAHLVADEIVRALWPYRHLVHTLTSDNGKEFALHKQIAQALDADFYFAHPYHAWERGLNENTNGLIRQYFPKSVSLANVDPCELEKVQNKLNTRPRKSLGYATPVEIFYQYPVALGT
jgi:IS30 family transposase